MGSYGVIREAVLKEEVMQHLKRQKSKANKESQYPEPWDYTICLEDEIISVFDNPMFVTYAIKTIRKSQKNIDQEILNLIAIQQEIYNDRDDIASHIQQKAACQIQYCIKLYDIYEDSDSVHLVMEYCEGDTLDRYFCGKMSYNHNDYQDHHDNYDTDSDTDQTEFGQMMNYEAFANCLDERSIKKIMRQLLYSLKCIHEIGIVHRDLKPQNIMIKRTKQFQDPKSLNQIDYHDFGPKRFDDLRIIDFGLSYKFHDQNGSPFKLTDWAGTPQFMAPEIQNGSYDQKCDIWSLGVIAYQMFSQGKFPFNG